MIDSDLTFDEHISLSSKLSEKYMYMKIKVVLRFRII